MMQKLHLLDRDMRARVRPHHGSDEDVLFELQTYGIQVEEDIFLPDGTLCLKWHKEWLDQRRALEEEQDKLIAAAAAAAAAATSSTGGSAVPPTTSASLIIPNKFDVLFGRGRNTREHTGNLRCALLVEIHQERYENANKQEKTEISNQILSQVHDSGGRFLKHDKKVRVKNKQECHNDLFGRSHYLNSLSLLLITVWMAGGVS
jgi:hypothetical protein